ncbi:MAG: adenylosuccinate synthase, partial [Chloroflexi bacterium]|nr:adenylosuccinate synthase [Chloroflexota bacterium]
RPRRVGWLDMVLLGYAVQVNGFTQLALTKLDILSGINPLKICVGYTHGNKTHKDFPIGEKDLEDFEPILEEMPGWKEDVQDCRKWEDLPEEAQAYIRKIEELGGVRVGWISVGPERDQMVVVE